MRTLVVVHSLKLGGMERAAVNLADAFAEAGHESHLLSCRGRPVELTPGHPAVRLHRYDQLRALLASGVGVPVFLLSRLLLGVVVPRSHFLWVGWLSGWLLRRHVRALERRYGRFDRIIFRGLGTFKYFWSFRDERSIYVLENVIHHDRPAWQKQWEWRTVLHDRHLVCVSSGVAASVEAACRQARLRPKSLRVVTNPCPVERIRAMAEIDDPDIPDRPYIVNVARLVPQKGHDLLLEAYARAGLSQRLVIVGEGELRRPLEARARGLGISDRVLFAGKRTNPYTWMRRADLFVLTSEYEGLGLVLTEALACGTPILSVDCRGGVRDVFQGELTRYLVPRTAVALAEGLARVLAEPPIEVRDEWLAPFRQEAVVAAFLASPTAEGSPDSGAEDRIRKWSRKLAASSCATSPRKTWSNGCARRPDASGR